MKILSAAEIKQLDNYTIENEPIASIDLMERAALAFTDAVVTHLHLNDRIFVFCGMGNNGGDGLAVARQLIRRGYLHVSTYVVRHSPKGSPDFLKNEERLVNESSVHYIETEFQLPSIGPNDKIIDAILGSGLSRPVEGLAAAVITAINKSGADVYSIDVPSGMFCDVPNAADDVAIEHTKKVYTFHAPKLTSSRCHRQHPMCSDSKCWILALMLPMPIVFLRFYYYPQQERVANTAALTKFPHKWALSAMLLSVPAVMVKQGRQSWLLGPLYAVVQGW